MEREYQSQTEALDNELAREIRALRKATGMSDEDIFIKIMKKNKKVPGIDENTVWNCIKLSYSPKIGRGERPAKRKVEKRPQARKPESKSSKKGWIIAASVFVLGAVSLFGLSTLNNPNDLNTIQSPSESTTGANTWVEEFCVTLTKVEDIAPEVEDEAPYDLKKNTGGIAKKLVQQVNEGFTLNQRSIRYGVYHKDDTYVLNRVCKSENK